MCVLETFDTTKRNYGGENKLPRPIKNASVHRNSVPIKNGLLEIQFYYTLLIIQGSTDLPSLSCTSHFLAKYWNTFSKTRNSWGQDLFAIQVTTWTKVSTFIITTACYQSHSDANKQRVEARERDRTRKEWSFVCRLGRLGKHYNLTNFVVEYFRHNDTPVVRASGRELSYVLLAGILMCYCVTFALVLRPTDIVCGIQRWDLISSSVYLPLANERALIICPLSDCYSYPRSDS